MGLSVVHVEEVQLWGEMVNLDSSVYLFSTLFCFGEQHSHQLF